ncbi:discoidin domain-containing protein [Micromonospora sp. SL1-18]|uniref:galactose-binding domain-containing protein n=1 Tax=Micromonospora sp. SL1-18 TaxID=3399128 RepID=UPI003A4DA1CE
MIANTDMIANDFKPFGYEYIALDGWINDGTDHNENGYTVRYKKWQHDFAYWADYVHSKGLKFGMYYNPSWVLRSIADDPSVKIKGTDIPIKDIVHPGDASKTFEDWYMVDPSRPGAEQYVKGMVEYYKSVGVDLMKVDFIRLFDDAYGPAATETFYRWMREAAGDQLVLYYANQKNRNHAAAESQYADMIRASEDWRQNVWYHTSSRNRGQVQDNKWPPAYNLFDGLVHLSDLSGPGKVVLDGDYSVLSTSTSAAEKQTRISLLAMAGSSINIGDNFQNMGRNDVYYKNTEILDMNMRGFVGKPLVRNVSDPRSQIWTGRFADGTTVVGLFNREDTAQVRSIDFAADLGLSGDNLVGDMWSHSLLGRMSSYSATIEPHGVKLLKIGKLFAEPSGGFFTGPQPITVHSIDANAQIRYTTNGTEPTADSPVYSGSFVLGEPGLVRAKVFSGDGQGQDAQVQLLRTSTNAVAQLAAGITAVSAPEKGATRLELPTVPAGYTIQIKSSDATAVIDTNGVITQPDADKTVNLTLEVVRTADGLRADTDPIPVVVPGKRPVLSIDGARYPVGAGDGDVDGLEAANGAYTLGMTWRSGVLTEVRLKAHQDRQATLRNEMFTGPVQIYGAGGKGVGHTIAGDTLTLPVRSGQDYRIVAQAVVSVDASQEAQKPGSTLPVKVTVVAADRQAVPATSVRLEASPDWSVGPESVKLRALTPGGGKGTAEFTVGIPKGTPDGKYQLTAVVSSDEWSVRVPVDVEVLWRNLALRKTATQSSLSSGGVPARAVDGNTNGAWSAGSVTHTDFKDQSWWQVDLGEGNQIDQIAVWGRTDSCCVTRLTDYYVLVSDVPFTSDSLAETLAQPGVWASHQAGPPTPVTRIDVGRTGRYVRVQLAGNNALSLAEVQVFGGQ